ncbi:MAG: hypothetical protein M3247_08015 [Thermoproteota archaeon]|nr:hypothetical protein [Thermoproteota archaeon]
MPIFDVVLSLAGEALRPSWIIAVVLLLLLLFLSDNVVMELMVRGLSVSLGRQSRVFLPNIERSDMQLYRLE